MSLAPGARLGPYEITGALGAGGMGEVFRARDTKLNREVAIKVLPAEFATDHERVARFKREAQVLASLNHPNIAGIFGLEETDSGSGSGTGTIALVMELVEGEDLSTLIARGPIPIAEALPIARQIAEALEAAHEQGIVHRDLKPGNIKLRVDGTVKVLDFGLAKATDPVGASNPNVSHSPTLTHQGTSAGMIIGTAAYMSPEQAKGKAVDKRADIWAFGVVLYEMLTGTRLFRGEDVSDTLASVLRQEVDFAVLPEGAPASVRRLVTRCLERDLKRRLRDIGEARVLLENPASPLVSDVHATPPAAGTSSKRPQSSTTSRWWPWAVAAVLATTLLAALLIWKPWRAAPSPMPRQLLASIGADASLQTQWSASSILSPDGTTLAFAAVQGSQAYLFVRKLDQLQATRLAGTEGAAEPFFSPDGEWIAFFAGPKLKKIPVAGGAVVVVCDAPDPRGGAWAEDDTIIFSPATGAPLRVPAAGGTPTGFSTLGEGVRTRRRAQALPDGKGILFTEHSNTANFDAANIVVVPKGGGPAKVVVRGGYYGRYVPSGHLIFMRQGTLFATAFDLDRLETTGPAVPALDNVLSNPDGAGAQISFSSEGTLAYVPGEARGSAYPIDWIARDGKTEVLRAAKADWAHPQFSPDAQKLALTINDGKQRDIWVYEMATDTLRQLTFDPGDDALPVWTPDGKRIVFASDRAKTGANNLARNLYWVNADGTGEVTQLTDSPHDQRPSSWHPSGRFLAFMDMRTATDADLQILPMQGDAAHGLTPGTPTVFLATPAAEYTPMFSPDGRFIAYFSNEAGGGPTDLDVYVRPFPGPGGKWRVSTDGGVFPRWSPATHELLFLDPRASKLMAAPYSVLGDSFRVDKPQVWSRTGLYSPDASSHYALHPDGKRVAGIAALDGAAHDQLVFMSNFFEYLKKIAPVKK